jgi:hypothetical protein
MAVMVIFASASIAMLTFIEKCNIVCVLSETVLNVSRTNVGYSSVAGKVKNNKVTRG